MYTDYDVYYVFKTVENEIKGKENNKILNENVYRQRISKGKQEIIQKCADLFNTRFVNINLDEYIRCGFYHFKTFNFDKMFNNIVIDEYIARDKRTKRKIVESKEKILSDLRYIEQPLSKYTQKINGTHKNIIFDYMTNKVGPTVIMYCIKRGLLNPSDIEWGYMTVLSNNKDILEKCVLKHYDMITDWDKNEKARQTDT
jgi:hypothetical protein